MGVDYFYQVEWVRKCDQVLEDYRAGASVQRE